MVRVKRGTTQRRRHNKVLKAAKGYRGSRKRLYRQAKNAVAKAGMHAYRHRRTKKREFRRLWITRINAAVRPLGLTYSVFMNRLAEKGIAIDRKMLSELAIHEPAVFSKIVDSVK